MLASALNRQIELCFDIAILCNTFRCGLFLFNPCSAFFQCSLSIHRRVNIYTDSVSGRLKRAPKLLSNPLYFIGNIVNRTSAELCDSLELCKINGKLIGVVISLNILKLCAHTNVLLK